MEESIDLAGKTWTARLVGGLGEHGCEFALYAGAERVGPDFAWEEGESGQRTATIIDGRLTSETRKWGPTELCPGVTVQLVLTLTTISATVRTEQVTARVIGRQIAPRSWTLDPWETRESGAPTSREDDELP